MNEIYTAVAGINISLRELSIVGRDVAVINERDARKLARNNFYLQYVNVITGSNIVKIYDFCHSIECPQL